MCNAWNHSLSCTCGWGGEGARGGGGGQRYLAESGLTKFTDLIRIRYRQEARAYVNPNAKCPVCGVPVYFYQSPEGGRVFFDHLGKPWPKHPCTNSAPSRFVRVDLLGIGRIEMKPSDWMPFICNAIHPAPLLGAGVYVLEGLYEHSELKLFCKESGLHVRAPYLIKKSDHSDSNFLVTTVKFNGDVADPMEFQATRSVINLIPQHLRVPPSEKSKKIISKNTKGKKFVEDAKRAAVGGKKIEKQKLEKLNKPKKNNPLGPTAMELAFGRANQKIEEKSK